MRTGSQTEAERAHEVQRYNNRIKACEDAASAQKRACEDDTSRLLNQRAVERVELTAERDAARSLADQERASRAAAEAERDQCRAEERAVREERDVCKATAARAAAPVIAAPAPHNPPSGGSVVPVSTAVPAAGDPPAPPPPPEPRAPPEPKLPPPAPPQQPAQAEPKAAPQAPSAAGEPKDT
ncbi:MAG: hypothetical protein QM820_24835 [Minicystis sp.]